VRRGADYVEVHVEEYLSYSAARSPAAIGMMTLNSVAPPSPLTAEPAADPCCFMSLVPCNFPVYVQQ
jgi:hypothetical protein